MNKQKWQGLTIALMISVLASTTFGSVNRNVPAPSPSPIASPSAKPVPTVAPTTKPVPTMAPTTKPAPTMAPATKPVPTMAPTTKPAPTMAPTTKPAPTMVPSTKPGPCTKPAPCTKPTPDQKAKPFMLDNFKVIANTLAGLGVDEAKLTSYIKEGKKLEDVLKAEKISTRKFKKCVIKEYNRVVDQAVKNKQLTCEQAKQLKAAIKQTIKNWLPKSK